MAVSSQIITKDKYSGLSFQRAALLLNLGQNTILWGRTNLSSRFWSTQGCSPSETSESGESTSHGLALRSVTSVHVLADLCRVRRGVLASKGAAPTDQPAWRVTYLQAVVSVAQPQLPADYHGVPRAPALSADQPPALRPVPVGGHHLHTTLVASAPACDADLWGKGAFGAAAERHRNSGASDSNIACLIAVRSAGSVAQSDSSWPSS